MLTQPTIDTLNRLKLHGMALALAEPRGKAQVFDQARQNIARRAAVLHRHRIALPAHS